ncbi:hypothetical protein ABID29_002343, partial [Streptococcus rupicaprae]
EYLVWDQGVAGSNPVFPMFGGVAQLARASGSFNIYFRELSVFSFLILCQL